MNPERQKYMRACVTAFLMLFCLPLFSSGYQLQAQHDLNRISAVERSDGLGYVIRYHLSAAVDSFEVFQPTENLIQMVLYAEKLDTSNFSLPQENDVFKSFDVYDLPSGFAVDITLNDGHYFNTRAYPDQNRRDLLLALTTTTREQLATVTSEMEPIQWSRFARTDTDDFEIELDIFDDSDFARLNGSKFEVVVIDAGHGGRDPGSIGIGGIRESDIALAVALKVGEYIEQNIPDLKVVYTRTDDSFVGLAERGKIANKHGGDLFVSIHANSFAHSNQQRQRSANGAEVYFLGMARSQSAIEVMKRENAVLRFEENQTEELTEEDLLVYELTNAGNMRTSEELAVQIEQQFRERAQRRSRGVKQAGFQVLYEASMPGVLIELGFITNPDEARFMNSEYGQTILASAIFRSIRDFKLQYDRRYNRQTSAN